MYLHMYLYNYTELKLNQIKSNFIYSWLGRLQKTLGQLNYLPTPLRRTNKISKLHKKDGIDTYNGL